MRDGDLGAVSERRRARRRSCADSFDERAQPGAPSGGSWVTYGLGTENENLPAFIVFTDNRGGPINGAPNWGNGYMPAAYQGTQFRSSGPPIVDLKPAVVRTAD